MRLIKLFKKYLITRPHILCENYRICEMGFNQTSVILKSVILKSVILNNVILKSIIWTSVLLMNAEAPHNWDIDNFVPIEFVESASNVILPSVILLYVILPSVILMTLGVPCKQIC